MSFILDALRKSETDRQQQASADFATIPASVDPPGTPKWIWALGALLLVNAAILGAFLLQDGEPTQGVTLSGPVATVPSAALTDAPAEPTSKQGFRERLEIARAERPAPEPQAAAMTASPPAEARARGTTAVAQSSPEPEEAVVEISSLALPTATEIRLNDGVDLPDLHLDIHVYGATSAERFVFINMQKLAEGDMLDAGPQLESITPDGVILNYRGTRFVLPRE